MKRQDHTKGKRTLLSHNIYTGSPVYRQNLLNSIINTTQSTRLNRQTRLSKSDIIELVVDCVAFTILFAGFVYLISISHDINLAIIAWLER